ncbi:cupin domain-containing protein [Thalassomonas haliotis]|uniref:Cupin domain-containing protein n=1 Tax=Thalassomonas haliotis TaxID=485448 RepID=A0ABY7VIW5_9GAMM|nr:cupin domain-containing protein [Thalassomonas haliotis]WDE13685.1 cupin domain-containing protein [Thalassomonas haliotis]
MYQLQLSDFTKKEFLRDYWQQKPVVIRRGFSDFQDPLSADELAGLATMEQVESRLVSLVDSQWQAEFGPFQSFEHLGEKNWSLVVQAVDHFCEPAAQLIEPFRFIPNWRLDDLMVSFATPGGGVGPHIDLYDVFICQGSGKRHWRVGDRGEHREFAAHEALLHVDPFEAMLDVELNPGDILYIPPGFPHEGITLETSMSFSVGFRTQSRVSLFSALADHLIDQDCANELIEDARRAFCTAPGEINDSDLHLIQEQFAHVLADKGLMRAFIGSHLSRAKHELDRCEEALGGYSQGDVAQILAAAAEQDAAQQAGLRLQRLGGLRAFYFSDILNSCVCYINGEAYAFDIDIAPAIKLLCDQVFLTPQQLAPWCESSAFIDFVTEQVNAGYWYFAQV